MEARKAAETTADTAVTQAEAALQKAGAVARPAADAAWRIHDVPTGDPTWITIPGLPMLDVVDARGETYAHLTVSVDPSNRRFQVRNTASPSTRVS